MKNKFIIIYALTLAMTTSCFAGICMSTPETNVQDIRPKTKLQTALQAAGDDIPDAPNDFEAVANGKTAAPTGISPTVMPARPVRSPSPSPCAQGVAMSSQTPSSQSSNNDPNRGQSKSYVYAGSPQSDKSENDADQHSASRLPSKESMFSQSFHPTSKPQG